MSGNLTTNTDNLTVTQVWSDQLKNTLEETLIMQNWVHMVEGYESGGTLNIPSLGDASVSDYTEDTEIPVRPIDTGNFQFTISEYLSSGSSVSEQSLQDFKYADALKASFVPKQRTAIMKHWETTMLEQPEAVLGATTNGNYAINGKYHRYAGGASGKIEVADFLYANLALDVANVPMQNRVGIVDPVTAYELGKLSNLVTLDSNPMWEGIVRDGMSDDGLKFRFNIFGFDIYMSNFLPTVTDGALPERDGSTTFNAGATTAKANYFFSAKEDLLPFISAWAQPPKVDYKYEPAFQKHTYYTTARYGKGLWRPETIISVVTDTVVSA